MTDALGEILIWNRQAELLYGWSAAEVVGRKASEVLVPEDGRERAEKVLEVVREGEVWEGDFTVRRRDGQAVEIWVANRPLFDDLGSLIAIVGASEDVTEQRRMEKRDVELTEHLLLALQAGGLGTFRWNSETGATEWDERLEALFGLGPGAFDGTFDAWVALVHPEDRDRVVTTLEEALASKGTYTLEHRVVWPDGSVRWLHCAGRVTVDRAGNVTGSIGCSRDATPQITARLERERLIAEAVASAEQERIHRQRLEFLSNVNDALAMANDRRAVMVNVAQAAVPRLGDWCFVYVLPHAGATIPDIEIAHVDPALVAYALELQGQIPYDPDSTSGMPNVIRTGEAEFYPVIDDDVLAGISASDAAREVVRQLALGSSIAVPLAKRGRVLGGLQLIRSHTSRAYTDDDLALARIVAARIASTLENMRLSEEQRTIASTLQASLLPYEIPKIPDMELAVRYWANGEAVVIGGDFYDVFALTDESWAVVIGDVCGTGPSAAALTGLARHTIASAGWHGDDHSAVLTNLNAAMLKRRSQSFCTVIYGTLHREADGVVFRSANAGHPRPVLARADGSVAYIGEHGSLLGAFEAIQTTTTDSLLAPGDTVVLYTDGMTDVAPPYGLGADDLLRLVGDAVAEPTRSAEEIADQIHLELAAILPIDRRSDDIALLVMRRTGPSEGGNPDVPPGRGEGEGQSQRQERHDRR